MVPVKEHISGVSKLKLIIILFYAVGVLGIFIPVSSTFFIQLTPLVLLLSFILLMTQHGKINTKTLGVFSFIFSGGLFVEIIGIQTGLIFGEYSYGSTLGPKIAGTPWLIGLNWLLMIYLTASIANKLKAYWWIRILTSSLLMLMYDIVLEQVAPGMDMWKWSGNNVPFQNYLAWFILSVLFHTSIRLFKIDTENKLSATLFVAQFLFFLLLLFKF